MVMFDTALKVANIVGAVAGIAGSIFAGITVLLRGRRGGVPGKKMIIDNDETYTGNTQGIPSIEHGVVGAFVLLISREFRRDVRAFLGDNLSDQWVYRQYMIAICYCILLFLSVLFVETILMHGLSEGLRRKASYILLFLLLVGADVGYLGYARFRRRFVTCRGNLPPV
jgi:hypothetical protein